MWPGMIPVQGGRASINPSPGALGVMSRIRGLNGAGSSTRSTDSIPRPCSMLGAVRRNDRSCWYPIGKLLESTSLPSGESKHPLTFLRELELAQGGLDCEV